MAETEQEARRAPYNVTWTTFVNAIEKLEPSTLPNRIDGSYLTSMAGGTRVYFIAAMKFFGLIDDANRITQTLRDIVADPDSRRDKIGTLLNTYYPFRELATSNATADELLEAIKEKWGGEGETARKQMSFYLQGCRWAGLPLSPHWPVGKPGGGAPRGPRRNGATSKTRRGSKPPGPPSPPPERPSETRTVTLPSGMTLTLNASQPLLLLPASELSSVLTLIKAFDALSTSEEVPRNE